MRDIKFRAWDKLNNRMSSTNISIDFVNQMCHFFDEEFRGNPTFITDFIPMQYTGLKDKNGVEIYEGDIVVSKSYPFYGDAPEIDNSGGKCEELNYVGVVAWCDKNLTYYLDYRVVSGRVGGHACGNMLSEYKNLNVIGNIYEDSHLLDKS